MAKQHRPNQPKNHGGSDTSQSQSTVASPGISASNPMQMSQLPGAGNSYALGLVQAKANGAALESDTPALEAQNGVQGSGTALPYADQIQASFGPHDVSDVRAHTGAEAKASTDALSAKAYATGSDIAFGSAPDLHTAAHEAAHVVQQQAGVHLKDDMGRPGDQYEQHADQVADAVVAGESAAPLLDAMPGAGGASTSAIQFEGGPPSGRIRTPEGEAAATPAAPSHRPDNNPGQGGEQEEFRGEDVSSGRLLQPGTYRVMADFPWGCGEFTVYISFDNGSEIRGSASEHGSFTVSKEHVYSAEMLRGGAQEHQGPSIGIAPSDSTNAAEYDGPEVTDVTRAVAVINVEVRTLITALELAGDANAVRSAAQLSAFVQEANAFVKNNPILKKSGKWITGAVALVNMAAALERGDRDGILTAGTDAVVHVGMGFNPWTAVLDGVLTALIGPDWPSEAAIFVVNPPGSEERERAFQEHHSVTGERSPWSGDPGKF